MSSTIRWGLPEAAERTRLVAGLSRPPEAAARFLLGQVLVRRIGRRIEAVRLVETEAYLGQIDPAAHAWHGRTRRTDPLWGPPGTVYVYLIYGMHHCLNFAADELGVPGCVLIRAAEPLPGSGLEPGALSGPGRLCRALAIDTLETGRYMFRPGSTLYLREGKAVQKVARSARVGFDDPIARPLRFYDPESPSVSVKRPPPLPASRRSRRRPRQ